MKILFTQDALVNAGAERSHLEILSRFSEDVDVGFVYFYPKHDLREAYERAGVRLFFLDIPESYHFPLAVTRLVRLIRKEKPDLLISSLWRADIITRIASVLTGVPLIGTLVNDSYSTIAWKDKKGLKYKAVYWLDRLTAGIPIHWIANANALADSHVKTLGLERAKISVVYRGRPVIARDVIASAAKQSPNEEQSSKKETASASNSQEIKLGIQEGSLAVTEDVIAPARCGGSGRGPASPELDSGKQSQNGETASASNSQEIKLGIQEGSLAVTDEVIAPARRGGSGVGPVSPELESGKQSFKEEEQEKDRFVPRDDDGHVIAPARCGGSGGGPASLELDSGKQSFKEEEQEKDRFVPQDDDGHVIAPARRGGSDAGAACPEFISGKQSSPEETASAAEDSVVRSNLPVSSLAPVPIFSGVTEDVIASDAGVKQSSPEETASAAEDSKVRSNLAVSSLAVTRNFISYGRLLERKGFQDAIQAFSQVLKTYPDCTLTIFGEGPYRNDLENLIQNLGLNDSVFLPGKLNNPVDALVNGFSILPTDCCQLPASTGLSKGIGNCPLPTENCLLITANCFLFPSWYEGFSGALVEAMMAGIPIIASNIPMNLEAVADQKTALVFQVGNSDDLAKKMRFAIEHPEQMAALGQAARKEAEERFDIEKIAREYERVVRSLTPPRPFPQSSGTGSLEGREGFPK